MNTLAITEERTQRQTQRVTENVDRDSIESEHGTYRPETSSDRRKKKGSKQLDQSEFLIELESQTDEESQRGRIAVLDLVYDTKSNQKKI